MVANILRLAAAATILIMGGFLFILWRLDLSVTRKRAKAATKTRYAQ
jgi:HAMP domain-containing protein